MPMFSSSDISSKRSPISLRLAMTSPYTASLFLMRKITSMLRMDPAVRGIRVSLRTVNTISPGRVSIQM